MNYKDMEVWKSSMDLVDRVYDVGELLPSYEKYGLRTQINKSAASIPSNIAEGSGRESTKEFIRFLDIANGSLYELETQLLIIKNRNWTDTTQLIESDVMIIRKMIYRLKQSLRNKTRK
ncbi:four helix bundle protein [Robertkochia marina]|uniref:Four helix bundle protein n=1 Tax=Robertkochia marina TaxID=1227945 RepID=A0A4S3M2A0_9FLAO|nr:four helix bundle protein [Robertkochia marina]THD67719.1 four helix bundle protein [Robertkochia marina]TRZ43450.1 four helix bundle protein [Robertkochia marina]